MLFATCALIALACACYAIRTLRLRVAELEALTERRSREVEELGRQLAVKEDNLRVRKEATRAAPDTTGPKARTAPRSHWLKSRVMATIPPRTALRPPPHRVWMETAG